MKLSLKTHWLNADWPQLQWLWDNHYKKKRPSLKEKQANDLALMLPVSYNHIFNYKHTCPITQHRQPSQL